MICHHDSIIPQPFLAVSSFVTLPGLALDLLSLSFSAGWKLFWDLKARILQSLILLFPVIFTGEAALYRNSSDNNKQEGAKIL